MRVIHAHIVRMIVLFALAAGLAVAMDHQQDTSAQSFVPELGAFCVNPYTGIVSAPTNPFGGTTCSGNQYALLIPDAFPITLTIDLYTGAIRHSYRPTPPGAYTIQLPDDGVVQFCVSIYTRQLRNTWTGSCPSGTYAVAAVGERSPDAVDDGPYTVGLGETLTVAAADPDDLLDNDDLGLPDATVVSFGFGTPPANAAGSTLVDGLAGGDLTVNSDGSFTLADPSSFGIYTFRYRIENSAGFDDASVTIQVQQAPDAVDDAYTTPPSTTLTVTASGIEGLLANDDKGFPVGEIVSFGLTDASATPADGATQVGLAGGQLTVDGDGSFDLASPTQTGSFTFLYRLENAAGSDDATVTIDIQRIPDAIDDGIYTMAVNGNLVEAAPALLANDDTGLPSTGIDSFGGGDLGGTVTSNAANSTVIDGLAGGDLTVNANGSFSLANPDQTGEFTFLYRLENAAGFDDATVTIEIQGTPDAVDDGPAADSAPGDLFHTAFDTTLDSTSTPGVDNLLSNDDFGFPEGDIVSFGGGDLGGTVTSNSAGETASIVDQPSGSLKVNADGSFVFIPTTGFTGEFTFQYRLENAAGNDDATVTIAVGVRPSAVNDSYAPLVVGNVSIDTSKSSNFGVLTNDSGDALTFTTTSLTSTNNGDVTLNADGTFEYDPAPGYQGSDSFTYEIDNGFSDLQAGTVSLTVIGTIWFIDVDADENGDGRLSAPFDCLSAGGTACFDTLASDDPADNIFLASGAYTGGVTLLTSQLFIGAGASQPWSAMTTLTPPADSPALPAINMARPSITTSNADAIVLGTNNLVQGMNIGNTGTGTGITGTSFGTLIVNDVLISGTGGAMNLDTGLAAVNFDQIGSSGGSQGINLDGVTGSFVVSGDVDIDNPTGDGIQINASPGTANFQGTTTIDGAGINGIDLTGSNGTVTFASIDLDTISSVGLRIQNNNNPVTVSAGSIGASNDPGGNAVDIEGGAANITIAASVTKDSGGEAVEVTGRSGGTVTLSGAVSCSTNCGGVNVSSNTNGTTVFTGSVTLDTGVNTAANMSTNSSHTVRFSGGLDIDTTGGIGFNATTSGTVEVLATEGEESITSTQGQAVNIDNLTTGITFDNVSSTDSAAQGIDLTNLKTGSTFNAGTTTVTNATSASIRIQTVGSGSNIDFGTTNIHDRTTTGIQLSSIAGGGTVDFGVTTVPNPDNGTGYGIRIDGSDAAFTFAAANISDTNVGTPGTYNSVTERPLIDGDGDAIFLKNNTGSIAINGGTITDIADNAVDIRNSNNTTLNSVVIRDGDDDNNYSSANSAIQWYQGSNLTLNGVDISNIGNDAPIATGGVNVSDDGLKAYDVSGTLQILNAVFNTATGYELANATTGSENRAVELDNDTGTNLDVTVTGSSFTNWDFQGLNLRHIGGSLDVDVGDGTVAGANTFQNINGAAINTGPSAGALTNDHSLDLHQNSFNTVGIAAEVFSSHGGTSIVRIVNNTINGTISDPFRLVAFNNTPAGGADARYYARVTGNIVTNIAGSVPNQGGGSGVFVAVEDDASAEILVDNNSFTGHSAGGDNVAEFVRTQHQRGGDLDLIISNNNFSDPTNNFFGGIFLQLNGNETPVTSVSNQCVRFGGNTYVNATVGTFSNSHAIDFIMDGGNDVFTVEGFTGSTEANFDTFLSGVENSFTGGGPATLFFGSPPGNGTCSIPNVPAAP